MRENLPRLATGNPQIEFKLEECFNKHPNIVGEYGVCIIARDYGSNAHIVGFRFADCSEAHHVVLTNDL